jgi:hypothetical protein
MYYDLKSLNLTCYYKIASSGTHFTKTSINEREEDIKPFKKGNDLYFVHKYSRSERENRENEKFSEGPAEIRINPFGCYNILLRFL